jgi:hypothetical protein
MSVSSPSPDYGIDLTLNDIVTVLGQWIESGYKLDVQAKSTTLASLDSGHVRYDLEAQSYNMLRYLHAPSPRLLVVLILPEDENEWLTLTEDELRLRRCAYWMNLKGRRAVPNRRSVRLRVPRTQLFSDTTLPKLMKRIKAGEEL